jgi:hypothetical protein
MAVGIIGEIAIEPETETFVCRVPDHESRRRAAALIKKLNPTSTLRIDGGSLALDLPTALTACVSHGPRMLHGSSTL